MAMLLSMPSLSPTMETGVITTWRKNVGDHIDVGEVLAEIETDKAVMDYEMADEGFIRAFLVEPGQEVPVGTPIAILSETEDEDISAVEQEASSQVPAAAPQPKAEDQPPAAGNGSGQPPATAPEQPPAQAQPPGQPQQQPAQQAAAAAAPSQTQQAPPPQAPAPPGDGRVRISPFARKLAEQQGLNWRSLQGSGPGGRIVARDIESAIAGGAPAAQAPAPQAQPAAGAAPRATAPQAPPSGPLPPFEDLPLSMMRKAIARTMTQSKQTVPHFQTSRKVRVEAFLGLRGQLKAQFPDVRISINDMLIKACAVALRKHPVINSQFLEDRIRRFNTVDVAVAVNTDDGLITPVVRNVEQKGFAQIATEVRALAEKARERKLTPEEYQGGTFTISNMGMFGVTEFNAIINPPQAAILAVAGVVREPVVQGDDIVPGQTMMITLSSDHRVIDGVAAAEFLATLTSIIETPLAMLM